MTWFKVDDSLAFHHKTVGAGNAAMGLWVRAGSWSAQQLTDGYVPATVVGVLGTPAQAGRLVRAGLWDEVDGGYQFHEWSERQPSRKEVLHRRKNEADRKAKARAAATEKNATNSAKPQVSEGSPGGTSAGVPGGVPGGVRSTRPDPTRPVLEEEDSLRSSSSSPRQRGTRIPNDFAATPEMVAWARDNAPDVDGRLETAQFIDHWAAKSGKDATKRDWVAAWRTWMRNAQKWHKPKPSNVVALRGERTGTDDGPGSQAWIDRAMARAIAKEQQEHQP